MASLIRPAVVVAGPTASGKSALALVLAEAFAGVVINADSMQVYRELAILTARPGPDDLSRAPHRLYGVMPAAERCSAARWRSLAWSEAGSAWAAGRLPILVGGTGLYLRAFLDGIADVPAIPESVRAAARQRRALLGPDGFHAEVKRRDPEMAARLPPGDSQRLIRAWEVVEATGRSLLEWQREHRPGTIPGLRCATILLMPPRAQLYAACDARFLRMVEQGALDEVRELDALGLDPDLPAMKATGVPELRRCLRGEVGLDDAVAAAQQSTRRYAKRQFTWFRHQLPNAHRLQEQFSERVIRESFSFVHGFLLTASG